jgi:hypothetical protein
MPRLASAKWSSAPIRDGPQVVTRHGEKAVVIVAYRDFVGEEPPQNFKAFLMSIPRVGLDIRASRRRSRQPGWIW